MNSRDWENIVENGTGGDCCEEDGKEQSISPQPSKDSRWSGLGRGDKKG